MDSLAQLLRALAEGEVRYAVIGVWGANQYAASGATIFATEDCDLFLPLDPENLVRCWAACEKTGLELWSQQEPLDRPRDRWLAERLVQQRALTRASTSDLQLDLTLVMAGFQFEQVWSERRRFRYREEDVQVARLLHIITSKHAAGRNKDRLFLATHREALETLLRSDADGPKESS